MKTLTESNVRNRRKEVSSTWSTPWAAIGPAYQEELWRENNESTLQNQATAPRRTALLETATVLKTLKEQRQETQGSTAEIKDTSFNSQRGPTTGEQEKRLVQVHAVGMKSGGARVSSLRQPS